MINKIKELLEQGKTVELECINENMFLNSNQGTWYEDNKRMLNSNLKVKEILYDLIYIEGHEYAIIQNEQQYFKIKEN